MRLAWSGLTRIWHTGWQDENGQPCAPWKLDNGEGSTPILAKQDPVGINVNVTFCSDFNAIPRPRVWVELEDATVWLSSDGVVMIRS